MHQARPYGLHVIGGSLTDKDTARINSAAVRFTNLKELSQLDSLKLVYDLPDGGSFIVQDMGGNFRVIAYKPEHKGILLSDGIAKDYIPMLFSGVVSKGGLLREGQGLDLILTKTTRRRIFNFTENKIAPRNVQLLKFSCPYHYLFNEFLPLQKIPGVIYTQYDQQRPTWYSGAMAEVMQIVGGYGKQRLDDSIDGEIDRARFYIPQEYKLKTDAYIKNARLPAYTGLPNAIGQFQCDYKHGNTDMVGFNIDNEPWLIKVNSGGVWAMPLPVVPATRSPAFREYINIVGDDEIVKILDRFGAMPSGEGFPLRSDDFQAWYRAGVIIKICDTADFFSHSAYSTAMGWSMNDSGSEAVNTCFDVDDNTGVFYSKAYKLQLRLGSAANQGWIDSFVQSNEIDSRKVSSYLSKLYQLLPTGSAISNAIKYKVSRAGASAVLARAVGVFKESELDYWNNLVLDPIASHSGNVTMISKGNVYRGVHIKVPEPYSKACISMNFLPKRDDHPRPKSDVIIFAYYIGDELKLVRYFDDPTPLSSTVESNFEEDMYVGSWSKTAYSSDGRISGSIYTTDIDYRKVLAPVVTTTNVIGRDMGYGEPIFYFPEVFQMDGWFMRYRYYSTETTTTTVRGGFIRDAILMPYFCRNATIFATVEGDNGSDLRWDIKSASVQDPNSYGIWTYHPVWAFRGGLSVMNGTPKPKYGHPVYAEILYRNPEIQGAAFADNGPWLGGLPENIESKMYGYTDDVVWASSGTPPQPSIVPKSDYKVFGVSASQKLIATVVGRADLVRTTTHADAYYTSSPDIFGGMIYRDGCKVVFGDSFYANISEEKEAGGRMRWGNTSLADHKSAHHFIGVINE